MDTREPESGPDRGKVNSYRKLGQFGNRLLTHDEFREFRDAAKILWYRFRLGHIDPEAGFKELDEFEDSGGVDDAHFNKGIIIQRSSRGVSEKEVRYDELG